MSQKKNACPVANHPVAKLGHKSAQDGFQCAHDGMANPVIDNSSRWGGSVARFGPDIMGSPVG